MAIDWASNGSIFESSFKDSYIQLPEQQPNSTAGFLGTAGNFLGSIFGGGGASPLTAIGGQLLGGLFSGSSDATGAGSKSGTALDTSGTVIGEGDAKGGKTSSSSAAGVPPAYWLVGAVAILAIFAYTQAGE